MGTDLTTQPSARPTNKVLAATAGAGVGGALAEILVHTVPALTDIESALAVVLGAALAFVGGWLKRDRA